MAEKFCWVENNAWWKGATRRMAAGEANDRNGDEWDEANRRLWCLAFEATRASPLKIQDLEDLVQTVLLRLQGLSLVHRLKEVDTPAHYLAAVMRNLLGNELRHARGARRNVRRHAKLIEAPQDQRPRPPGRVEGVVRQGPVRREPRPSGR